MGNQDGNNKDVKSKIEQIRIDLEKKLAAIEKSKTDTPIEKQLESDIKKNVVVNKEVKPESQAKPVFEITEPIESIEPIKEETAPKIEKAKIVSKDTSKKEANIIVAEKRNKSASNITKKAIINKDSDSKKIVIPTATSSRISTPPKTVISSLATSKTETKPLDEVVEYEEKSKRGILSYLLYGLLIALFIAIGYLFMNQMKEKKELDNEIMKQRLSEFENKRYLDSIELADLNYQLLDLQSKKMIDSLDLIYEKELLASSDLKGKKPVKRNFSLKTNSIDKKKGSAKTIKNNIDDFKNKNLNANNIVLTDKISKDKVSNKDVINDASKDLIKDDVINDASKDLIKDDVSSADSQDSIKDINTSNKEKDIPEKVVSKPKIRKSPVYPGCEKKKTELDRKKCLTSKMYRHVSRKFNSSIAQNTGLDDGIHVVRVNYIIDKSGYATVLNVRAENKKIEQEAIRVIQSLPKMTPATIDGKKTKTQYNIPIKFIVGD